MGCDQRSLHASYCLSVHSLVVLNIYHIMQMPALKSKYRLSIADRGSLNFLAGCTECWFEDTHELYLQEGPREGSRLRTFKDQKCNWESNKTNRVQLTPPKRERCANWNTDTFIYMRRNISQMDCFLHRCTPGPRKTRQLLSAQCISSPSWNMYERKIHNSKISQEKIELLAQLIAPLLSVSKGY